MTGASRRHDIALAERTMQLMNRHWISLLALSVTTLLPAAVQARSWTTADAIGIEGIGDVQLSPDGTLALIAVFEPNLSKNEVGERYWLVRIADGREWPIAAQLTQPRWSPSGVRIAWLDSDKHGVPQLVVTGTRGGSLRVLTHGPRSVVAFAWSHDGGRLAAIETPPVAGRPRRMRPMTLENDYRDITPPKRDVWIVDERTAAQRRLTDDTWSYGGPETDHDPSWSAGDARIAVVRQPTPVYGDFEHQQYVTIALAGGETRQILNGPFFVYPGSVPPMFAPSGDEVAYPKSWDGKLASRNDLFIGDRDVTAPLDRDLWSCGGGGAQWAPRMLAVELLDGVSTRLFRVDPAGGTPQALTLDDGSAGPFSIANDGRIAYAWSTPAAPSELYVLDPGKQPRRITHLGHLGGLTVATTRVLHWTSNGQVLHGQLTLPPGANLANAPLVVEPHGGPQCADDSSFAALAQLLASRGYAYFRPDPRGSDGYGDWSYKAVVGDWGAGPMADDMAGVDAVLASGVSSPSSLFIEGGSYGGYLTSWIVTHTGRFKAAVAQVPVTDLLLEYTLGESPNILRRFFGDKPATDPALLARESPQTYAAVMHTPLLLMIGLKDTRAPYVGAIAFYKTIAENGGPVQLLADAESGHGPNDPQGLALWWKATFAWFAQHGGVGL